MSAVNVISVVYAARRDDGFVVSDFKRYRNRCSHRIAHYRRAIGIKKLFYRDENDLLEEHRNSPNYEAILHLVLFEAERALGEAMQAHHVMQTDTLYSKMRHRLFARLRRAVERATVVAELGQKGSAIYISCLFYMHYVRAILRHELEDYTAAAADFDVTKALLEKMLAAPGADLAALQFFSEDINKRRSYCIYMVSAFVDDPVAAKLLEDERNQIVAKVVAAASSVGTAESEAFLELRLLTGSVTLALPQGPICKHLEPLLKARSSIDDLYKIGFELLSGYEAFYGCAIKFYFGEKDEATRKILTEESIRIKTIGKKIANYKAWIARFRSLCLVYREKTGSFDKPRLDAILVVLNDEIRAVKLVSGLTMVIYRLIYLQDEKFIVDTGATPAISLGPLPLKGKSALRLVVDTIAALEGMTAPTHRAINALNATNAASDPLLSLLLALHSLESAIFLCNKRQDFTDENVENNKLKRDLLKQSISRFYNLSNASAAITQELIQPKLYGLGELFPEFAPLLVSVLKNNSLFSSMQTLATNRLIVLITEAQKKAEPVVFQLYGLLPPPYVEDMVPSVLTDDFIMELDIDKSTNVPSSKEIVEKVDVPKKKRFFGLF